MTTEKTNKRPTKEKSGIAKFDLFETTIDFLLGGVGVFSVVWVYFLLSL